jgi:hypothetical protein
MDASMKTWRHLTKSERDPRVRTLLQNLCVAEALHPGGEVFLISPWTRNIDVIDNRAGEFDWVDPDWPRGRVRLLDWVRTLCRCDARVKVLQGDGRGGHSFNAAVRRLQRDVPTGTLDFCQTGPLSQSGTNHAKAILTSNFAVTGSMNISEPGLEMHVEHLEIRLSTDREYPEIMRQFSELWRLGHEG